MFKRKTAHAPEPSHAAADTDAQRQRRDIARATALKIDAIESAMAFDIFKQPRPAWDSGAARPGPAGAAQSLPDREAASSDEPGFTLQPQTAPVVDEVAILFANRQTGVAQQMLQDSLADAKNTEPTLWWMLFDLLQVTGQRQAFDDLSIDYANKFETSPPAWVTHAPLANAGGDGARHHPGRPAR